jgi:hypothetical protein
MIHECEGNINGTNGIAGNRKRVLGLANANKRKRFTGRNPVTARAVIRGSFISSILIGPSGPVLTGSLQAQFYRAGNTKSSRNKRFETKELIETKHQSPVMKSEGFHFTGHDRNCGQATKGVEWMPWCQ